jgi:hypothetical protein
VFDTFGQHENLLDFCGCGVGISVTSMLSAVFGRTVTP